MVEVGRDGTIMKKESSPFKYVEQVPCSPSPNKVRFGLLSVVPWYRMFHNYCILCANVFLFCEFFRREIVKVAVGWNEIAEICHFRLKITLTENVKNF